MHPQVKKAGAPHPDLMLASALAKHLLSPSNRFENSALLSKSAAQDGLRCLATLDKPTLLSLPTLPPEATQPQVAPVEPPASSRFGSHKPEYKAGLQDSSVVDALLEFHARKRPLGSHQAPLSTFKQVHATTVAAQPKPKTPAARQAQQSSTTRVFRPRGE